VLGSALPAACSREKHVHGGHDPATGVSASFHWPLRQCPPSDVRARARCLSSARRSRSVRMSDPGARLHAVVLDGACWTKSSHPCARASATSTIRRGAYRLIPSLWWKCSTT
jgi:hypothetical protein